MLLKAEPMAMPPVGAAARQLIDWGRRYRHMRVHTCLHLLSVVIKAGVTGGNLTADGGRLDFELALRGADWLDGLSTRSAVPAARTAPLAIMVPKVPI